METITIFGSYGEIVVNPQTGTITNRLGLAQEYSDIGYFLNCPNCDTDILFVSFITLSGVFVPAYPCAAQTA